MTSAITRAARGRACTIRLVGVCDGGGPTTVWAHRNSVALGKGMGIKVPDHFGAFACWACHEVIDGRASLPVWYDRVDVLKAFDAGERASRLILVAEGLVDGKALGIDVDGDLHPGG